MSSRAQVEGSGIRRTPGPARRRGDDIVEFEGVRRGRRDHPIELRQGRDPDIGVRGIVRLAAVRAQGQIGAGDRRDQDGAIIERQGIVGVDGAPVQSEACAAGGIGDLFRPAAEHRHVIRRVAEWRSVEPERALAAIVHDDAGPGKSGARIDERARRRHAPIGPSGDAVESRTWAVSGGGREISSRQDRDGGGASRGRQSECNDCAKQPGNAHDGNPSFQPRVIARETGRSVNAAAAMLSCLRGPIACFGGPNEAFGVPALLFRPLKLGLARAGRLWRASGANAPGPYCTLICRRPGHIRAPHYYSTGRYGMVRQA